LALAATGDGSGALAAAARAIEYHPIATYRDRALAHLAAACAHHQLGDRPSARVEMDAAAAACAGTDDQLSGAVIALGAAHLAEAEVGEGSAGSALARAQLDQLGAGGGWETLVLAALRGMAPAP
jgi:hypothetical protein